MTATTLSSSFEIGRRYDGRPLRLPWPMPHTLVAGLTRSGKTVTNHNIIGQLAGRPEVAMVGLDPKRADLSLWASRFTELAVTFTDADRLLFRLRALLDHRMDVLAEVGRVSWSTDLGPWVLLVIDEFAEVGAIDAGSIDPTNPDPREADRAMRTARTARQLRNAHVSSIARLGAGLGVTLVLATQYPTVEVLDSQVRTQLDLRIMHRVSSSEQVDVCLGNGRADQVDPRSVPASQPGSLWMVGTPESPEPIRGRSHFVPTPAIRARAASTARFRWPAELVLPPAAETTTEADEAA